MSKAKDTTQSDKTESKLSTEELENNWKRALADYKNLEKRVAEEKQNYTQFANEVLLRQLLPVLDNLESLQGHIQDEGLSFIVKDFKNLLQSMGILEIELSEGDAFDSTTMDCIETVECEKHKGSVHSVVKKGYTLQDKVLRPAVVTACEIKRKEK